MFWEDENLHKDAEQLTRQKSATNKKLTPINIDYVGCTGYFKGSSKKPYTTTLESCTCGDFIRRRLPCKHIYRLAHELNIFNLGNVEASNIVTISSTDLIDEVLDKTTGEITDHINLNGAKSEIDKLSFDELVLCEDIFDKLANRGKLLIIEDIELAEKLNKMNLCSLKETFDSEIINILTKSNLINIIKTLDVENKIEIKSSTTKTALLDILENNFNDKLPDLLSKQYYMFKHDDLENDYGKLRFYTRTLINNQFIDTDLCLSCFESKHNVKLNNSQYKIGATPIPFQETKYVVCSNCNENEIIRINKDIVEIKIKI